MFDNKPKIAVIGLGYVGLPTAIAFHDAGFDVSGVDINENIVKNLRNGTSHLIDSTLRLEIPISSQNWRVTSNVNDVGDDTDIFLITVPTPVDKEKNPDLRLVAGAVESVLKSVEKDSRKIIVVESTLFPGATRKIFSEIRNKMGQSFPKNVEIAYSPERVSPGDVGKSAAEIAKIVGADNHDIGAYLAKLYTEITSSGCRHVGGIEVAEAAKMIENTQRDIDIAFVNELAKVLPELGLDVMDVIDAASTKWNFHSHTPGIGVGGHCIPVDPYYYIEASNNVGVGSTISPVARKINESMPRHTLRLISDYLDSRNRVAILGLSYKPNVGDTRESPVFELINLLIPRCKTVCVWDPLVPEDEQMPNDVIRFSEAEEAVVGCDITILATAHDECINLDWTKIKQLMSGEIIFDGPRKLARKEIESYGFRYKGVGLPDKENNPKV